MFEINSDNLKFAFLKLKTHYFYYFGSLYLKEKIIKFERKYYNDPQLFEKIANKLITMANDSLINMNSYSIGYILYPKKDGFQNLLGRTRIDLDKINFFIDMDIELHLVDVIFTLNLYRSIPKSTIEDKVYSSLIDERVEEDLIHNRFLFQNYRGNYQSWKRIPEIACAFSNEEELTILKTDLKSCYYSIRFNIKELLRKLGLENDASSKIMKSVFNIFTDKVLKRKFSSKHKHTNVCLLPIGLFSSGIILNYLLRSIDNIFSQNSLVYDYGRYVDDILLVFKGRIDKDVKNIFEDLLEDLVTFKNGEILISPSNEIVEPLIINKEKTKIKYIKNNHNFNIDFKEFFNKTSFIDYFDEERDNCVIDFFEDKKTSTIRKEIFSITNGDKRMLDLLETLDYCELLNILPLWFKILKALHEKDANLVFNKIKNGISSIEVIRDGENILDVETSFRNDLLNELNFAFKSSRSNSSELLYLLNVFEEDLFKYIENFLDNKCQKCFEFFPVTATLADISLYFSNKYLGKPEFDIFKNTIDTYEKINRIYNTSLFNIKNCSYEIEKGNPLLVKITTSNIETDKNIKIGLLALNMHDLEGIKEIENEFPQNYSLYDILDLIERAGKEGVKYLLLPEFAIDKSWVIDIVRVCRKFGMSLMSGLTRCMDFSGNIVNLTLIYEGYSSVVLLKPKNYYPYKELILVENNKQSLFLPKTPYYYVIKDGSVSYSVATCYEVTNIKDRAAFAGKINTMFLPVFNRDTNYFSAIIKSFSRDISCFIAQANSNKSGDSCIHKPSKTLDSNIVKIKGGINSYLVIGEINPHELMKANKDFINNKKGYENKFFKPLSAGDHFYEGE